MKRENQQRTFNIGAVLMIFILSSCMTAKSTPTLIPITASATPAEVGSTLKIPTVTVDYPDSPTPSPTSLPTSTSIPLIPKTIPEAQLYVFEIEKPDEQRADLIEHLYFYFEGGAGGPGSSNDVETPALWTKKYEGKILPALPMDLEWTACSFSKSSTPQATLTIPDGSTVTPLVLPADSWQYENCFSITYTITPGALLGDYSLLLSQGQAELSDTTTLEWPLTPSHVVYQEKDWFAGYMPGETITITIYSEEDILKQYTNQDKSLGDLHFWFAGLSEGYYLLSQEIITADETGSFQIAVKTDLPHEKPIEVTAYGEVSGFGKSDIHLFSVREALTTRLHIGDTARVTDYLNPLPAVNIQGAQNIQLEAGSIVRVRRGPFYITGSPLTLCCGLAWIGETPDKYLIYLLEGDSGGYYLEPILP